MAVDFMFSARAKIARAAEHIDSFNREAKAWGDSDPLTISRECDPEGREHIFRIHWSTYPDLVGWSVVLGDALHDLRGALDHAVYALAVANCGKDPPDDEARLAFPITTEPRLFDEAKWRIRSLSEPAQAAIERLQPYNRLKPGKWFMALWWLSRLHDIDKHRLIHVATVGTTPHELEIGALPGSYVLDWNTGPHIDGAPILRVTLQHPDPKVRVNLRATGGVVLNIKGERPIRPFSIYWITKRIQQEVEIACRYLALHLPDPLPKVETSPVLRMEELAPGAE